jgi:hypothetical protein
MLPEIKVIRYNNARFEEGSTYAFTFLKKTELSETESYYVLLDPKGYKILLPAEIYAHYGFEPGSEIRCRIDKINCSGQVFLEPLHPFYSENETYAFEITRHWAEDADSHNKHYFIELSDVNKMPNIIKVTAKEYDKYSTGNLMNCRVDRIKKAKLHLRPADDAETSLLWQPGNYYPFMVKELSGEYFILSDPHGNTHKLECNWYDHYNIRKGDEIRCKFLHFSEDGSPVLEPENPYYRDGEVYEFPIRYIQKMDYADGSSDATAIVGDVFGEEAHLRLPSDWISRTDGKSSLSARVDRIRKSRVHGTVVF